MGGRGEEEAAITAPHLSCTSSHPALHDSGLEAMLTPSPPPPLAPPTLPASLPPTCVVPRGSGCFLVQSVLSALSSRPHHILPSIPGRPWPHLPPALDHSPLPYGLIALFSVGDHSAV